jgi:hypothetical protein
MTASVSFYNNWREAINDAALRAATIKATLHSSSYTFSAAHNVYADLTNELATAVGYTNGGQALAGVVWDHSGVTANLDANDTAWTASGGSIVARRAVLRVVGTFNSQVDPLILSVLLDTTPADVTVTTGNVLTLIWDALGIFTVS